MRAIIVAAAGVSLGLGGMASAQSAKNSPEAIVCAMTGDCEPQAADGDRVPVGKERAFSLARPSSPAASTTIPTRRAPYAAPRTRAAAVTTPRRAYTPARVQPGGGIDMRVTFPVGSAQLTPQAQTEARAFAQAMAAPQMAGMRFAVEGHTDATGLRDKNVSLSQARAQSVVDFLVAQGVESSRLTAKGFGPDRPLRGTRPTASANRRVEFVKGS